MIATVESADRKPEPARNGLGIVAVIREVSGQDLVSY
jgi:hypothetical protein